MTPDRFAVHVRRLVERIEADGGMARLERQRRATKLSAWVDQSGMGRLAGQFDPVTFARLHRRLADTLDTMFADATPDTCPSDPFAKQDHLRALALVELVCGNAPGAGRPELITVLDTRADDGAPVTDWGIPVEVPLRVLIDEFGGADVHTVVVRNGVVIHAPGQLNLGGPPGSPTAPSGGRCGACTPPVPSPAAPSATTTAPCTTSPGGATAAPPTSTTSSPCAPGTTARSTTRAGGWP